MPVGIFEPLTIKGVKFNNRLLRSSIGGRTCDYDGYVTATWRNFERRFAEGGLGGIISTTFHVTQARLSPLEYPSLAEDKYVPRLKQYVKDIQDTGCRYIIQIGDPGYATQTSLFPQEADAKSSSGGFDLVYGYNNCRIAMTDDEIETTIRSFADAAERVTQVGADGIEITITKGYLVHQFLNPGINRRRDKWGGDAERRFEFLRRIVTAVRERVGPGVLLGVRMSAADYNWVPVLFQVVRWPLPLTAEQWRGNDEARMLDYALRLRTLGIDFIHMVSGFGFPNPRDVPGDFPTKEIKLFYNSTRHLTAKAWWRAAIVNVLPSALFEIQWKKVPMINLDAAMRFKAAMEAAAKGDNGHPVHVIVNGGFQQRAEIQKALDSGLDMVSMARALLANPDLPKQYCEGATDPVCPCTRCNRCVGRTGTSPLGCYEPARFASIEQMKDQIMTWNRS